LNFPIARQRRWAWAAALALATLIRPLNAQEPASELDPAEAARLKPAQAAPEPVLPYTPPRYDPSEAERLRVIRRSISPERPVEGELRITPLEGFLDYDEEGGILYGPGRTQVIYRKYFLEADRVILDNRLQEVQAEGNVILRVLQEDAREDELRADSLRYNFAEEEGVAFNAWGRSGAVYFKTFPPGPDAGPQVPPFQQLSQYESIFRDTAITTCSFPIPHYSIRAREVILFPDDRIFFRGATFRIGEVPVLYLPFYSRSLAEGAPWFFKVGVGGRTGARLRIGYQYEHSTAEPSFDDETRFETRSFGQAQVFADILSKRGLGGGANYKYEFDFGRHRGYFEIYGIFDSERRVADADIDEDEEKEREDERWQILWRHRSQITPHLYATFNIDYFSDPEIFYDILDQFAEDGFQRERQIERRARAALTYLREAYVLRVLFEIKDRAGIDRFNDFSDPADNNLDFEFDPGRRLRDVRANSIARSRWGRVSERLPEATFATRYLPIRDWPLYILSEIRAYNNLDKGLNIVDEDDDARVRGIDVYHQLLWQYQITERMVLLAKLGVGFGVADRSDDDLGIDFSSHLPGPDGLRRVDGLRFVETDGTFLVGEEEFNLDDIEPFYAWIDAELRLNYRISDALSAYLLWRWRETTDDFIGDFYARLGDVTSREDLFNYRLREHWFEGGLTYQLLYPSLVAYFNFGLNLESKSDRFPNETLGYWTLGTNWINRTQTLQAGASIGQVRRELFHPSDPRSGEQTVDLANFDARYQPIHGRWYTRLGISTRRVHGESAEDDDLDDRSFFTDEDNRIQTTWVYGRELGPKWDTEIRLRWDDRVSGLREVSWLLQRDLHDAVASLRVRVRRDVREARDRRDNPLEFDVTFGLEFKPPVQEVAFGAAQITTLQRQVRRPALAY